MDYRKFQEDINKLKAAGAAGVSGAEAFKGLTSGYIKPSTSNLANYEKNYVAAPAPAAPSAPAAPAAPAEPAYNPLTEGPAPGTGNWSASQPYVTKDYSPMEAMLRKRLMERFNRGGLPPEYESQGLQGINSTYAATNQALQNKMATSGLYGSPMQAAAMGASEAGRAGEMASFKNQLPLLQRSLENEDMTAAAALMSAFGRGQGGFSQAHQLSGGVDPYTGLPYASGGGGGGGSAMPYIPGVSQSPLSGAFSDMTSTLASLYGMGAFNSKPKVAATT